MPAHHGPGLPKQQLEKSSTMADDLVFCHIQDNMEIECISLTNQKDKEGGKNPEELKGPTAPSNQVESGWSKEKILKAWGAIWDCCL